MTPTVPLPSAVCALLLCWLALLSSGAASRAHAQLPDLIDISGQYMPGVALDAQPAEAQVSSYEASFNVPIVLGERTFLIPGAGYHADSVSYARAPAELDQISLLQSMDLSILFIQLLPRDWSLSVRLAAGLAGDFETVDSGMFRVGTLVMASHVFSERFVLGGGGSTNYSFGSLLPMPVVYVDFRPFDALQLEAFVPAFANFKYAIDNRVEFGLRAEVSGNAYALRTDQVREDWPCAALAQDDPATVGREDVADPARCTDHVAYSVIAAGVQVGVRLVETLWLTGFAGHTLYRRLEPMTAADEPIDSELQTLPNALCLRMGLTWRLPRE